MTKKIGWLAALGILLLCFAGCGQAEYTWIEENSLPNGENSSDPFAEQTLVIGGIGPITGVAAAYGIAVRNGAQMAVDEINAAGGVNGIPLQWLFEDDAHDTEKAVSAYKTLMDKGMHLLLGTVTAAPCTQVALLAQRDKMFMLTPTASVESKVQNGTLFGFCAEDTIRGAAARHIQKVDPEAVVGVIYHPSDPYSAGVKEAFVQTAAEIGLPIAVVEICSDTDTDFSSQLRTLKNADVDAVFMPVYYETAAHILVQAKQARLKASFFGGDGLDGVLEALGTEHASAAEGLTLFSAFSAAASKEFTEEYRQRYGQTPTQFAALGYDAVYALKAACEKANITLSMHSAEMCVALQRVMTELSFEGLTGQVRWNADGTVVKEPVAFRVSGGKYVAVG